MPVRPALVAHLSVAELQAAHLKETDAEHKRRLQTLWQVALGKTYSQVADLVGGATDRITELVARFNREGLAGLVDRRSSNGRKRLEASIPREELIKLLSDRPPDGGLWSGPKLARWLTARLERRVTPQGGWRVLKRLGFSLQRPRPQALQRPSEADLDAAKKKWARTSKRSDRNTQQPKSRSGQRMKRELD